MGITIYHPVKQLLAYSINNFPPQSLCKNMYSAELFSISSFLMHSKISVQSYTVTIL